MENNFLFDSIFPICYDGLTRIVGKWVVEWLLMLQWILTTQEKIPLLLLLFYCPWFLSLPFNVFLLLFLLKRQHCAVFSNSFSWNSCGNIVLYLYNFAHKKCIYNIAVILHHSMKMWKHNMEKIKENQDNFVSCFFSCLVK